MSFIERARLPQSSPVQETIPPAPGRGTWEPTTRALAALTAETLQIQAAPEGTRNATLNTAAYNLGQLVAGGEISEQRVIAELTAAALGAGLDPRETANTIRSGMSSGAKNPREAPRAPQKALDGVLRPEQARQVPEGTSWAGIDLAAHDQDDNDKPTQLARTDGTRLFYPGKVNGIIGESESGKTWIALEAARQALNAGQSVLILDFEDSPASVKARLTSLGATDLARLTYAAPDEPLHDVAREDLARHIASGPDLIILDGFNAAMTLMGLDLNSNKDATQFSQLLLKPLTATGACVIYVDHLPKNREAQGKGGIGAQAKRAMTSGCSVRVDVETEFGRGMTGRLKLTVDKDRPGHVRAVAAAGRHLGQATLASRLDHSVSVSIDPAEAEFRPTTLMGKVEEYLIDLGAPASKRDIRREVRGDDKAIDKAIEILAREGIVTITAGPRGALLVTHTGSAQCGAPH